MCSPLPKAVPSRHAARQTPVTSVRHRPTQRLRRVLGSSRRSKGCLQEMLWSALPPAAMLPSCTLHSCSASPRERRGFVGPRTTPEGLASRAPRRHCRLLWHHGRFAAYSFRAQVRSDWRRAAGFFYWAFRAKIPSALARATERAVTHLCSPLRSARTKYVWSGATSGAGVYK